MMHLAKKIYKKIFRGSSKNVVAPPGEMIDLNKGKPIIVASFPRSGTHLMIDTILNNFPQYRNKPLYLDFDQITNPSYNAEALLQKVCHAKILIKTHYPYEKLFMHENDVSSDLERLHQNAFIIKISRDERCIQASYEKGFGEIPKIKEEIELFEKYWQNKADVTVDFEELVNNKALTKIIEQISVKLNEESLETVVFPPRPDAFINVGFQKIATRLLGKRTPFGINTTIQFKN